jgi:glutaredoxin 3
MKLSPATVLGLVFATALGAMGALRVITATDHPTSTTLVPLPDPVDPVPLTPAPPTAPTAIPTFELGRAKSAERVKSAEPLDESRIIAEAKAIPVTLYSANYCPWCRKAKAHMDARGISYSELRIDENPAARRDMDRIGGHGIPTIVIDGDVNSGYNPAWVESTLRAHAERRLALRARL